MVMLTGRLVSVSAAHPSFINNRRLSIHSPQLFMSNQRLCMNGCMNRCLSYGIANPMTGGANRRGANTSDGNMNGASTMAKAAGGIEMATMAGGAEAAFMFAPETAVGCSC